MPWVGTPVEDDYQVTGTLRPRDATADFGSERIREFKREAGRAAVESDGTSPAVIVALGLALLAAVALGVGYLRLRRRLTPR